MTLILSCLTQNYVVQISDRRLTFPDGTLADDNTNKAVTLCHHFAFSYTGLSTILRENTDIWLTKVLTEVQNQPLVEIGNSIAEKATIAFEKIHHLKTFKRHAFVGVGWAILPNAKIPSPTVLTVSNAQDENGRWLPEAQEIFTAKTDFLDKKQKFRFLPVGQELEKEMKTDIERRLRLYAKKDSAPLYIAQFLCNSVRKVSSRNPRVGKSLLGISIPKSAIHRENPCDDDFPGMFFVHALPNKDSFSFFYVPADESEKIAYGPNVVCGGSLTGFSIGHHENLEVDESRLPINYYTAILLSPFTGSGTWKDPYRIAIQDDYERIDSGHMANAETWPKGEPCPYFGCVIGAKVKEDMIELISNNSRYFVITRRIADLEKSPDAKWLNSLMVWLVSREIRPAKVNEFVSELTGLTFRAIVQELIELQSKKILEL